MRKNVIYLCFFCLIFVLAACKKEGMQSFDSQAGISMYRTGIDEGRDSLLYSFAIKPNDLNSDTIKIPLRIVGMPSSKDRTVKFGIIDSLTNAIPASYDLLPSIIPAGSYIGTLMVKINKTDNLKAKDSRLWIQLLKNEDFTITPKELSKYLIKFNNYLSKPVSWDEIRFGEYSQTKYALIIHETGYSDFSGLHPEVLLYIVGKCRNVLNAYQKTHGEEMFDENELPVRFP